MVIRDLKLNFQSSRSNLIIRGRRDVLSRSLEGSWATLFKGRGMEFTGYRQYTFSDDASAIDWRATLRSKDILVREFEEFKNYNVYFFLDTSNTMLFSSGELFKAEYGANVLFNIAEEASASGDAIGLGMFNDQLKGMIQPAFGKGMRLRMKQVLLNKENYGGKKDFRKSMLQLSSILGERSIIILISDFLGLPDDWAKYISMLSRQHHVMGVMIRDERDRFLPKSGQFYIKDPNSNETIYIDVADFKDKYKNMAKESEERVVSVFKRVRSDCLILENEDKNYLVEMRKFFNKLSSLEY